MEKNIETNQQNTDRLISLILLVFCISLFPAIQDYSPYGAVFPNAIAIVLTTLCGIYFIKSWITLLTKKVDQGDTYRLVEDYNSFVIAFPITIIYIFFLLSNVGFYTSSVIFAATMIIAIKVVRGQYNWKTIITYLLFAFAFSALIYYIFSDILRIRLPTGILI